MNNLGRKAHVCVSVCLSSSAATSPFKERSKTQRGTKKCWRLFQKVFFFFSFFATRIQQKPNIKAGPERDRNKRRRRETPTRPSTHPFEGRASVCVCVCTTAIEMCVLEEVRYRIPKFAAAAAVAANGWLQVPAAATHAMDHAVALACFACNVLTPVQLAILSSQSHVL